MRKTLVIGFGMIMGVSSTLFAAQQSAELSISSSQIKLTDAVYAIIPTRTETRQIPGCNENGDVGQDCTQTIVLESEAVIQANVAYQQDFASSGDGMNAQNLVLTFKLSDFSAEDVAALKAVYPAWKHPFSKVPQAFAAKNLKLSVNNVTKTIQVVDVRNSKICYLDDSLQADPSCVEKLSYKPSTTTVKEVTVSTK